MAQIGRYFTDGLGLIGQLGQLVSGQDGLDSGQRQRLIDLY